MEITVSSRRKKLKILLICILAALLILALIGFVLWCSSGDSKREQELCEFIAEKPPEIYYRNEMEKLNSGSSLILMTYLEQNNQFMSLKPKSYDEHFFSKRNDDDDPYYNGKLELVVKTDCETTITMILNRYFDNVKLNFSEIRVESNKLNISYNSNDFNDNDLITIEPSEPFNKTIAIGSDGMKLSFTIKLKLSQSQRQPEA